MKSGTLSEFYSGEFVLIPNIIIILKMYIIENFLRDLGPKHQTLNMCLQKQHTFLNKKYSIYI